MDKLLMLMNFKMVVMQYMMFGMNTTIRKFLIKNAVNIKNSLINYDDIKLIISRQSYRNLKDNFTNHKQKHNVSLTLNHETNTKTLEDFLVDNKPEFL